MTIGRLLTIAACAVIPLLADQITMKNGDRFTGAVVAKERYHLAVVKIDRSAIDSVHAAKSKRDIAHLDERAGRSIHRSLHRFVRSFPPPIGVGCKLQRKSRRACSVS